MEIQSRGESLKNRWQIKLLWPTDIILVAYFRATRQHLGHTNYSLFKQKALQAVYVDFLKHKIIFDFMFFLFI